MIFTEISYKSGGYLLFMRSKLLNQKELWQNENLFLLAPVHLQYIPLDGHNVTLTNLIGYA
jgi:hypothetical protein